MTFDTAQLERFGFDNWFQTQMDAIDLNANDLARVVAVHRDSCTIHTGETQIFAEVVGRLAHSAESAMDFPAVGDWVVVSIMDDRTFAVIHHVLPRKSLLKRKTVGKRVDFQVIAANIDTAFIVQSLNENFNLRRIERYLVMIHEARIQPVVLLSKTDLVDTVELARRIAEIKELSPEIHIVGFSNKINTGLDRVHALLLPGHTYCLLGSSGVGKTSLLNNLVGDSRFKTAEIRDSDGKGRHATSTRQLIHLDGGAMIVDTPGMRELGVFAVDTGIDATFHEISELAAHCRYADCRHDNKTGCAVMAAVADGRLAEKRYLNFMKMTRESEFQKMSYLEKKKKDKAFGKMVKTVMKNKKNKR